MNLVTHENAHQAGFGLAGKLGSVIRYIGALQGAYNVGQGSAKIANGQYTEGADSDTRAAAWSGIQTFAEHPVDNTSTALTNYWSNTTWNQKLEDSFVVVYGAGLSGGAKLVSKLDTSPIITAVDVPGRFGQSGQLGITLTPNPKLEVGSTTKVVGTDQPQNPQGQRTDLEAVHGAENKKISIQEQKAYHDSKVAEVKTELEANGYKVSKQEISFKDVDSQGRTRPDIFASHSENGSLKLIEVKTGNAELSIRQSDIYPQIKNGDAIPVGKVAKNLGLKSGISLKEQGYPNGIPIEIRTFTGAGK